MLSANRSRWGQRLGQKKAAHKKTELMKSKSPRNQTISRTFGKLYQSGYFEMFYQKIFT